MIIRASLPGHVTGLTSSSQVEENSVTVWIYVDTSKQVGDPDHLKVFAGQDDADRWFRQNDPEGVAFEYSVIGEPYDRMIRKPAP
jgi:hypothetical protein